MKIEQPHVLGDHLESIHTWEFMLRELIQVAIKYGVPKKRAQ